MFDEELEAEEASIDDVIEKFMKDGEDDTNLSDDEDHENSEAEDDEAEEETDEESSEDEEDSEDDPDEDSEDNDEDDDSEEEDSEETDEEDGDEEPNLADEEAEVVVEVDGESKRVSVKELKRLAGQEASLTQKSQAVANQRRSVEAQGQYLASLLQKRYEAAKENYNKYKDVDLFRANRELEPEDFDALKSAKENAENELQALEREGQEFLQNTQKMKSEFLKEQAKESLKVISKEIPEWSDELYDNIRSYAVSQGMDKDIVNEVVDPGAIIMMHKAMKYDQAQKTAKSVEKKVKKAPKKAAKKSSKPTDNKTSKLKAKQNAVKESGGDIDDVVDLFLASASEE